MYIKGIVHIDRDALEADVVVSDGVFDLLCYAQPFEAADAESLELSLTAFLSQNLMRATEQTDCVLKTQDGYYSYRLQGRIVDRQDQLLAVGNLVIEIDGEIPGDIGEGESVAVDVMRVDLTIK